ncbi:putative inactive receptor kinase [Forsythia ovata]|uniref:Inactive receptor kinase n=1 Tax=Forsythia ovata TaxID=205694 RepID=A0ABD1T4U3_9LAMI
MENEIRRQPEITVFRWKMKDLIQGEMYNRIIDLKLSMGYHQHSCDPATSAVTAIALDLLGLVRELKFTTLVPLMYLQNLTLSGNFLTDRLVPAVGLITSLQVIDLFGNQFYGPIPARLNNLWALHHLNLSNNNFSGWFPPGIRNLQQLKALDLHSNQLQGDLQEFISELRNVEHLDLSGNTFYGSMEMSPENVSS